MKKIIGVTVVFFLLVAFSTPVSAKHVNIFATAGGCGGDYKGPSLGLGLELQMFGKLYWQVVFDYYPEPIKENVDVIDYSANSIGLYLSYKIALARRIDFFIRGGGHYSTIKIKAQFDPDTQGIFQDITAEESDGGVAFGGGFEYLLNRKFGILIGADYNILFSQDKHKWFKVYGGISFALQ